MRDSKKNELWARRFEAQTRNSNLSLDEELAKEIEELPPLTGLGDNTQYLLVFVGAVIFLLC